MAKRVKATINPDVLQWARTSASYTRLAAAEKLALEEAILAAWEAGEDQPSISQLRRLAALYKRPLAVLYPPEQFPGWWVKLEELVDDGRVVATIEVFYELEKKDDDVFGWAKQQKDALFREIDEDVQGAVVTIMAKYPRLVDTKTGKSGGDPFVIAQAVALGAAACVLTEEDGGSDRSPRIPYVCKLERVDCCNLIEMMKREQWSFN